MDDESAEKTAFITHKGLYEFKRMPFGLCNASAVFQRAMNKVLAPFIGKFCVVYIDDVVVYSQTPEEHSDHLRQIFTALQENGVKLKPTKCHLRVPEIKLLGFIIDQDGRRSDPEKTAAIDNMAAPQNASEVRSFLGMVGYHRHHIPRYAELAYPLVALTKKYAKFVWGEEEVQAWRALKSELVSDRVMAHPRVDRPYKLYTDASAHAVGAVLVQEDDEGVERPIMYLSKQLNPAQKKYATIEREAFAVIYALQKLRPYLHGADFVIYTDHKPLKSLFLQEQKNTRIQRWAVLLAEYGAPIEYRKGSNNIRADMLSRIHQDPGDASAEGVISALEEMEEVPWEFDELEREKVIEEQKEMEEYELGQMQEEEYIVHEGLLYTLKPPPGKAEYPRLVLPPSARFRVIRRAHTEVGHQGVRKTLDRLQEAYKWPYQRRDVYEVLSKCAKCAVNCGKRERPAPGEQRRDVYEVLSKCAKCAVNCGKRERPAPGEMPIAQYPCQIVGMDMSGPYPMSKSGNCYALSLIDHCTGWVDVKALPRKTAEQVLRYLESEYLPRYGTPEVMIMDNGLEFKNHLVKGYLQKLGVEVRHCTPFHPQSNGKVERFHKTLKQILSRLVNARGGEWEECLGPALWAHRVSTSSVTGYSPYYLTYGRKPAVPHLRLLQRVIGTERDVLASRLDELSQAFKDAARHTEASRIYNKERLAQQTNASNISVGDHVAVWASGAGQLDPKWDHGYVVTRVRGPVIFVVGPRNQRRTLNRDKVRRVDPDSDWDNLRVRLTRAERMALRREQTPAARVAQRLLGPAWHARGRVQQPTAGRGRAAQRTHWGGTPMRKRPFVADREYWPPKYVRLASGPEDTLVPGSDRVLRSSTKRDFTPSTEEQSEAKRLCVAAVLAFCTPTVTSW